MTATATDKERINDKVYLCCILGSEMLTTQCASHILMVRPAHFGYNAETASSNAFQSLPESLSTEEISRLALQEFDQMVETLRAEDISVWVHQDSDKEIKPDAVFPNNWVSFHANGSIITYPMFAEARRLERDEELIDRLTGHFGIERRYSLELYEEKRLFLEGTGSLVLDRIHQIAYANISSRTDATVLDKFCALTGYRRVLFRARDEMGRDIYHTNVLMCVGAGFAVVCFDAISNEADRQRLLEMLDQTAKEVIPISFEQMRNFAGNMIQLQTVGGRSLIVMSARAHSSLLHDQLTPLEQHGKIITTDIHTIETVGGGSARCMIAEIFLARSNGKF